MGSRPWLTRMRSSLSFKLFIILSLCFLALSVTCSTIRNRSWYRMMEEQVRADAYRASDFIKQSLLASMMENDRAHMLRATELLGGEPGIEAIRIYNKNGVITFSGEQSEIGTVVDLKAEACYACHSSGEPLQRLPTTETVRIYKKQNGDRVMGVINPILNRQSCWSAECHAHTPDQAVLGVLDVQMSMQPVDEALAAARRQGYMAALVIIFLAALLVALIVYYAVYLPIRKLRAGTDALAAGNLDVEIDLDRSDELGALAGSFNQMTRNLKTAYDELRAWSHTLENRVREKTDELQQIHQQLMQVEKAASLGKMAATVAHELNNPLSGVLTFAKLASKRVDRAVPEGEDKRKILEHLEIIRSETTRCGNIVRDLLTYSRESSASFQRSHLHELIERSLKLVGHHIELGGVTTKTEFELKDDLIICDPDQIVQVLIALLINAVEAMPDGGSITVRSFQTDGGRLSRVGFSVSDTGVGIPEDARGRIFDPFFSTKGDTKGVGLGLAVVYGIVQRHEGEIRVESVVGKGSTFTIDVPRDPERAASARAAARKKEQQANGP